MRGLAGVAILGGAALLAGCSSVVPPSMPAVATKVETSAQGRNLTFTVTPWPLDATVAFVCVNKPGKEFTVEDPRPAVTARCVPLDVSTAADRLKARITNDAVRPDAGFRLARPWYLAVAGSRGPFSAATVLVTAGSGEPGAS